MEKINLKEKYLKFFEKNGHKIIPSAPLIPENDPTCLFNTAGMQPLVPYLMGQPHPLGTRLVDVQKCVRLTDLEEIGDKTHHTFFEMLGNWSLGDYFKKEAITWSFTFLTQELQIPIEKLAVTVFAGNNLIPRDDVSAEIWKSLGIPAQRISYLDECNNFWIAGEAGPCGPDTEIFYWRSNEPAPVEHNPDDERWVEIWNNVFMQYEKHMDGTISELPKKNVDTGMGVERTVAILEGVDDNYETSIWKDMINEIEKISQTTYKANPRSIRIIADHIRTAVFIAGDYAGIKPSNTDQGYILRRLIRRMIRHAKKIEINLESGFERKLANIVIEKYGDYYHELVENKEVILEVLTGELNKFNKTLEKGLKEFEKIINNLPKNDILNKELAFKLYDTYGFPLELTVELAKEKQIKVDEEGFKQKFKEHQEKSRAGSEQKFKGGLSGNRRNRN